MDSGISRREGRISLAPMGREPFECVALVRRWPVRRRHCTRGRLSPDGGISLPFKTSKVAHVLRFWRH